LKGQIEPFPLWSMGSSGGKKIYSALQASFIIVPVAEGGEEKLDST